MRAHYQHNVPDLRRRAALTASVLASLQLFLPLFFVFLLSPSNRAARGRLATCLSHTFSRSVPSSPLSRCSANGVGSDGSTGGGDWGGGVRGGGELMRRKDCEPPVRHLTKSWEVGGKSGAIPVGSLVTEPRAEQPEDGTQTGRRQPVSAVAARLPVALFCPLLIGAKRRGGHALHAPNVSDGRAVNTGGGGVEREEWVGEGATMHPRLEEWPRLWWSARSRPSQVNWPLAARHPVLHYWLQLQHDIQGSAGMTIAQPEPLVSPLATQVGITVLKAVSHLDSSINISLAKHTQK